MAELKQVYKCSICGNIVEILHGGKGKLVCCNKNMDLLEENTVDAAKEKHVPAIEKDGDKVVITVGSTEHPMEEKHYIEWIELIAGDKLYRQFLKPGDAPRAEFVTGETNISARAYCNLHGLWMAKL